MKHLAQDNSPNLAYTHHASVEEMYESLYAVTQAELKEEREKSPYSFFSVQIDEATDSSNKSVLVAYLMFMDAQGDIRTQYLSTAELQATNAEEIYNTLLTMLKENDLELKNMVGLATDGASVMRGSRSGVTTR